MSIQKDLDNLVDTNIELIIKNSDLPNMTEGQYNENVKMAHKKYGKDLTYENIVSVSLYEN